MGRCVAKWSWVYVCVCVCVVRCYVLDSLSETAFTIQ